MSLLVAKAKEQIKEALLGAAQSAIDSGAFEAAELPEFAIEVPANREHGDYAANAAMVWARAFRKAPRMIAETLKEENHDEYFEKVAREQYGYCKPGEKVYYDSAYGK